MMGCSTSAFTAATLSWSEDARLLVLGRRRRGGGEEEVERCGLYLSPGGGAAALFHRQPLLVVVGRSRALMAAPFRSAGPPAQIKALPLRSKPSCSDQSRGRAGRRSLHIWQRLRCCRFCCFVLIMIDDVLESLLPRRLSVTLRFLSFPDALVLSSVWFGSFSRMNMKAVWVRDPLRGPPAPEASGLGGNVANKAPLSNRGDRSPAHIPKHPFIQAGRHGNLPVCIHVSG